MDALGAKRVFLRTGNMGSVQERLPCSPFRSQEDEAERNDRGTPETRKNIRLCLTNKTRNFEIPNVHEQVTDLSFRPSTKPNNSHHKKLIRINLQS